MVLLAYWLVYSHTVAFNIEFLKPLLNIIMYKILKYYQIPWYYIRTMKKLAPKQALSVMWQQTAGVQDNMGTTDLLLVGTLHGCDNIHRRCTY